SGRGECRATSSSGGVVASGGVWPWVAALAPPHVRTTLLYTSWAVNDHPEVCEWVRRLNDLSRTAPRSLTRRAHSRRAARSLATSMKKFIPIAQKNDSLGAKRSEEHTSELQSRF